MKLEVDYIDIHVHHGYPINRVWLLQNLFPDGSPETSTGILYSAGLHPWHIRPESVELDLEKVARLVENPKIIAVGESGLDAKVSQHRELQEEIFLRHIDFSARSTKPLIVHCVGKYDQLLSIRKKTGTKVPWIIHWFSGGPELAADLVSKNCYLSFGISLFNEKNRAIKSFINLPPGRFFFETDDAGITIEEVYARAASLRGIPIQILQEQVKENFLSCFNNAVASSYR